MTLYISARELFEYCVRTVAGQQAVKYHVKGLTAGSRSIMLNRYNLIIDTILATTHMADGIINDLSKEYKVKLFATTPVKMSIPDQYFNKSFNPIMKKWINKDIFVYLLGLDIINCLSAMNKAKDHIGEMLIKKIEDDPKPNTAMQVLMENQDWKSIVLTNPETLDESIIKRFCSKDEKKQLRLIYYNQSILKDIHEHITSHVRGLATRESKPRYSQPSKLKYYMKDIKIKLQFLQTRFSDGQFNSLYDYFISCCTCEFIQSIPDNSIIVSRHKIGSAKNCTYKRFTNGGHDIEDKEDTKITIDITPKTTSKTTMIRLLERNTPKHMPVIDPDSSHHLELFMEYPQNVLYGQKFNETIFKEYDWDNLFNGLNANLWPEYQQDVPLVLARYKFSHFALR